MKRTWPNEESADTWAVMVSELDQARAGILAGEEWGTGQGTLGFAKDVAATLAEQTGLVGEQREVAEGALLRATLLGFGVGFKLGVGGIR